MKIAIIVVVCVLVLGGGALLVGMKLSGHADADAGVTSVRIEPVGRGDLTEIVTAPGVVQPRIKVQISARVAARIIELPFEEGQRVTRGNPEAKPAVPASVLVRLDDTEMQAQLRASKARFDGSKASLAEAESRIRAQEAQIAAQEVMLKDALRDLTRQKQLLESKDVSQAIVDAAQAKYDQQEKQLEAARRQLEAARLSIVVQEHTVEAAEADVAKAQDNLSYCTITSPIDGVITRMNAKAGEMVIMGTMNNPGTVILEVSDLSEMQVDAQIDESNIAAIKEGQKAKVRISAFADDTFDGTVKLVGLDTGMSSGMSAMSGSSSQGKWYRAKVVLDTKGKRIPAGLSADCDIETAVHKDAIRVPTQAVMGRPVDDLPEEIRKAPEVEKNKTLAAVVFRMVGDKAVVTPVTIGASDMSHTLIESGLKEGEKLIVGPYKALPNLKHDVKVKDEKASSQPSSGPASGPSTTRSATGPTSQPTTR